jgi:hypothetical protein
LPDANFQSLFHSACTFHPPLQPADDAVVFNLDTFETGMKDRETGLNNSCNVSVCNLLIVVDNNDVSYTDLLFSYQSPSFSLPNELSVEGEVKSWVLGSMEVSNFIFTASSSLLRRLEFDTSLSDDI